MTSEIETIAVAVGLGAVGSAGGGEVDSGEDFAEGEEAVDQEASEATLNIRKDATFLQVEGEHL